jgi:glutamate racemase
MKSASIGIFDSGFGGLTVMNAITELLPYENIAYFADTKHLPYGNKTAKQIIEYSHQSIVFLEKLPIKLLVVACHSSCVSALACLQQRFPFPILGIAEAGIEQLNSLPSKKRLAVLGTERTIASGMYQKKLIDIFPQMEVFPLACPFFVPLIEQGHINHPFLTPLIVKKTLKPLTQKTPPLDAILLACTHYPLLKDAIQKELDPSTVLINPSKRCAQKVQESLVLYDLQNKQQKTPQYQFYVSSNPERFQALGKNFFSRPIQQVSCILSENFLVNSTTMD